VRRGRPPAEGEWSIPGGLVELGETLEHAVVREALEETGLQVKPLKLLELVDRIFPDGDGRIRHHYVLADYLCAVIGGRLRAGSDASEARRLHRDDIAGLGMAPVTLAVIHKAFEDL